MWSPADPLNEGMTWSYTSEDIRFHLRTVSENFNFLLWGRGVIHWKVFVRKISSSEKENWTELILYGIHSESWLWHLEFPQNMCRGITKQKLCVFIICWSTKSMKWAGDPKKKLFQFGVAFFNVMGYSRQLH